MPKKKRKPKPRKVAAFWIAAPGAMTVRQKRQVAMWFRDQARAVERANLTSTGKYRGSFSLV